MRSSKAVARLCVERGTAIREAVARMDSNREGILLVVDEGRRLLGTITDGDVRRAVLARIDLALPVDVLLERKAGTPYARPITAPLSAGRDRRLELLRRHNVLHIPLLDPEGRVAGLAAMDDFVPDRTLPLRAVVMAGGKGSRLYPLTRDLPKPMLPVGDRPLMEIILQRLREAGIRRVQVTTHHHKEKIRDHFQDGRKFGVDLSYVDEKRPLGTAGALGLIEPPRETVLVVNGDVLTLVDYRAMLRYHREINAALTVAVRQYDLKVPYGVIECDGPKVTGITEKPTLEFFVNAGIYLLEPVAFRHVPGGERFDMTQLMQNMIREGHSVASFPMREYWLDIGRHEDYLRAQQAARGLEPSVKPQGGKRGIAASGRGSGPRKGWRGR